ncbi:MAG: xanthine dehydrogenase family protein subunit M [Chloroflexota bacterium]
MSDLEWLEPTSIAEALDFSAQHGEEGKLLAGGTWLALVLKQGLLVPSALISLHQIAGLNHIRYEPGIGLRIGAMVSLTAAEKSAVIREHFPELAYTCGVVANVRIRNQATVGGCLCDADYASDPPSMFAALDARVVLQGNNSQREVAVSEFITGHYETVIEPGEILIEVIVPERADTVRGVYLKYRTRSHEDRPCVGVAAIADIDPAGVCRQLSIAIGAVADTPQLVNNASAEAVGQQLTPRLIDRVAKGYADSIEPLSDIRGSSWYRQQMIHVHVKRALSQLGGVVA